MAVNTIKSLISHYLRIAPVPDAEGENLQLVMHERHFYRSLSGPSLKKFGPVLGLSVPGPRLAHHYRCMNVTFIGP